MAAALFFCLLFVLVLFVFLINQHSAATDVKNAHSVWFKVVKMPKEQQHSVAVHNKDGDVWRRPKISWWHFQRWQAQRHIICGMHPLSHTHTNTHITLHQMESIQNMSLNIITRTCKFKDVVEKKNELKDKRQGVFLFWWILVLSFTYHS